MDSVSNFNCKGEGINHPDYPQEISDVDS